MSGPDRAIENGATEQETGATDGAAVFVTKLLAFAGAAGLFAAAAGVSVPVGVLAVTGAVGLGLATKYGMDHDQDDEDQDEETDDEPSGSEGEDDNLTDATADKQIASTSPHEVPSSSEIAARRVPDEKPLVVEETAESKGGTEEPISAESMGEQKATALNTPKPQPSVESIEAKPVVSDDTAGQKAAALDTTGEQQPSGDNNQEKPVVSDGTAGQQPAVLKPVEEQQPTAENHLEKPVVSEDTAGDKPNALDVAEQRPTGESDTSKPNPEDDKKREAEAEKLRLVEENKKREEEKARAEAEQLRLAEENKKREEEKARAEAESLRLAEENKKREELEAKAAEQRRLEEEKVRKAAADEKLRQEEEAKKAKAEEEERLRLIVVEIEKLARDIPLIIDQLPKDFCDVQSLTALVKSTLERLNAKSPKPAEIKGTFETLKTAVEAMRVACEQNNGGLELALASSTAKSAKTFVSAKSLAMSASKARKVPEFIGAIGAIATFGIDCQTAEMEWAAIAEATTLASKRFYNILDFLGDFSTMNMGPVKGPFERLLKTVSSATGNDFFGKPYRDGIEIELNKYVSWMTVIETCVTAQMVNYLTYNPPSKPRSKEIAAFLSARETLAKEIPKPLASASVIQAQYAILKTMDGRPRDGEETLGEVVQFLADINYVGHEPDKLRDALGGTMGAGLKTLRSANITAATLSGLWQHSGGNINEVLNLVKRLKTETNCATYATFYLPYKTVSGANLIAMLGAANPPVILEGEPNNTSRPETRNPFLYRGTTAEYKLIVKVKPEIDPQGGTWGYVHVHYTNRRTVAGQAATHSAKVSNFATTNSWINDGPTKNIINGVIPDVTI